MIQLSLSLSLPRLSFRPCSPLSLSVFTSTGMFVYNRSYRQSLETGQGAWSLTFPPSIFLLLALPASLSHSISRTTRASLSLPPSSPLSPSLLHRLSLPPSFIASLPPSSPSPLPKVFRGQTYLLTFVKKNIVKNPPKMPTLAPAQ